MTEYRTVPVEPTEEMLQAFDKIHAWLESNEGTRYRVLAAVDRAIGEPYYKAMLAAAPTNELAELEREIAEYERDAATAQAVDDVNDWGVLAWNDQDWYYFDQDSDTPERLRVAFRYLELRGLLERHPDDSNLVRVKE